MHVDVAWHAIRNISPTMHRCHVRFAGVASAEALLRAIHAQEATLLPLLVPDGECEAFDVVHVGGVYRVRARIRTSATAVMWVQVEDREVLPAVRECFEAARMRLERRSLRPTAKVRRPAPPQQPHAIVRSVI